MGPGIGPRWVVVILAIWVSLAGLTSARYSPRPATAIGTELGLVPNPAVAAPSGQFFDYVVIILMENHNLCDIYYGNASGSPCGTTPTAARYETGLSNNYSIPLDDHYCNVNPSLPNYLCLSGGSTFGCQGYDGLPRSNACTDVAWNATNIVDRLFAARLTWKAYAENMPSNCYGANSGSYYARHYPWVYYKDIVQNASRVARCVPAGTNDATFLSDLNATSTASNYMWFTPNGCNDMHDCSITTGDNYLKGLVPKILDSPVFTTQRAALFIVYDEGYGPPTYATWAGPVVKRYYSSLALYGHFSLLSTVESNWNLPYLNATNDGAARNMDEFFTTAAPADFSISASPTHLDLLPNQVGTSTVTVMASGGFAGTVSLSTSSAPSGVTASCTPSSMTPGGTSICSMSAAAVGTYTVNVTGSSGTLVHRASVALTVATTLPISANFTVSPTSPTAGAAVTFAATASGGALPYAYSWAFGDGQTGTGVQVGHTYASAGTYTATLTVSDAQGATVQVSKAVIVGSPPSNASPLNPLLVMGVGFAGVAVVVVAILAVAAYRKRKRTKGGRR